MIPRGTMLAPPERILQRRVRVTGSNLSNRSNLYPADERAGIPELIRRLSKDSTQLVGQEIRLARLEMADAVHAGGRGTALLAVAFGAAVVALTALTIAVVAGIVAATGSSFWIAAVELCVGALLIRRHIRS
jgi:Putative Actinobacterial Holin-X, holin superfamily III